MVVLEDVYSEEDGVKWIQFLDLYNKREHKHTKKNNNWEKKGPPRNMSIVTPYTMKHNLTNNISLNNFNKGNIVYLYFRNKLGKIPVAYSENSLRGLIKNNLTNLNNYLSRVKNNKVLFTNTQTRKPVKRKYIRKVRLI